MRPLAADNAIPLLRSDDGGMIFGQRGSTGRAVSCALGPPSSRQTLHELERQLHSEVEVQLVGMLNLPEPERMEDADIDQPPHEASPTLMALPAW
jgi:hypothetical protein